MGEVKVGCGGLKKLRWCNATALNQPNGNDKNKRRKRLSYVRFLSFKDKKRTGNISGRYCVSHSMEQNLFNVGTPIRADLLHSKTLPLFGPPWLSAIGHCWVRLSPNIFGPLPLHGVFLDPAVVQPEQPEPQPMWISTEKATFMDNSWIQKKPVAPNSRRAY